MTAKSPKLRTVYRRLQIIRFASRLYRLFKRISHLEAEGGKVKETAILYAEAGRSITITANLLCGGIVKVGQFLSLRQELFPAAFTSELVKLQDHVAPVQFQVIRKSVESELGQGIEALFEAFEEHPIASASLAQVHRARLRSGETVAVKVLRPDIERLIAVDLATLGMVARVLNRLSSLRRRIDLVALHRSFTDTLTQELNLRLEADHMQQFADDLGTESLIVIPKVFPDYTTSRLLVMTYLSGANIMDSRQLETWHVDRTALRDALLTIYLQQILVSGVVHLDPHPGNLLVLPEGKLALLDFGMIGTYQPGEQKRFRRLMQCIFFRDIDGAVQTLQELGYVPEKVSTDHVVHSICGLSSNIDLDVLRRLWKNQSFRLEARYMLLIRCLGMLKSVLTLLAPDETDWIGVVSERALPLIMSTSNPRTGNVKGTD